MRKLIGGLKLAAAGLLMAVVTAAATGLVLFYGPSDCLRETVLGAHSSPLPTLRISADGRVLDLDGIIIYGLAQKFERLLDKTATVKVVHLNSVGGAPREARRMALAIKSRNIDLTRMSPESVPRLASKCFSPAESG